MLLTTGQRVVFPGTRVSIHWGDKRFGLQDEGHHSNSLCQRGPRNTYLMFAVSLKAGEGCTP